LEPEILSLLISILGGFISGLIFLLLPGKIKLCVSLEGKILSETSREAEFKMKILKIKIPISIFLPVLFLIATIYASWLYLSDVPVLREYIFVINTIIAVVVFSLGLIISLIRKLAFDFDLSRDAYRGFLRKITLVSVKSRE